MRGGVSTNVRRGLLRDHQRSVMRANRFCECDFLFAIPGSRAALNARNYHRIQGGKPALLSIIGQLLEEVMTLHNDGLGSQIGL